MQKDGSDRIVLTVGSPKAQVNGKPAILDSHAGIVNAGIFIPLRFIFDILGTRVSYYGLINNDIKFFNFNRGLPPLIQIMKNRLCILIIIPMIAMFAAATESYDNTIIPILYNNNGNYRQRSWC